MIGTPSVADAAVAAPNGSTTADALSFDNGDGVAKLDHTRVQVNETIGGKIFLWGANGQPIALQFVPGAASPPKLKLSM